MSLRIQNSRQLLKRTNVSGATPTVNTGSTQHTDGTWTVDEIYAGEFYWNMEDTKLWLGWEDISGNTGVELIYPGGSSFTGGSGNCITDFYVENINACNNILDLQAGGNVGTGYISALYTTATNALSELLLTETIGGVPNILIQTQDSGATYTNQILISDTGMNLGASLVGATSHGINMDVPGDTMNITTQAIGGEVASIDLAYDSLSNETSIVLRTEDNSFTEVSSINMDKDGITLFSSTNTLLINASSFVSVGQNEVTLNAGKELFGVTPTYVYHSNTSLIPSGSLENFIFYHNEKITTTGTTPTTLYSIPFTGGVNTVMTIKAIINGSDNVGGDVYGAEYFGVFKSVGGVVTQISTLDKSEKTDFATATTDIVISGTNIIIEVTGEAATTIKWVTRFNYTIS
jgi:hypothetical protein